MLQWEPHKIVACLLETVIDNLEELVFTPSPDHQLDDHDVTHYDFLRHETKVVDKRLMGSLRDFENLKHIRVYAGAFYNELWGRGRAPKIRLVDALPATVETLALLGPLELDEATDLLSRLSGLKTERLPRLREISFNKTIPLHEDKQSLYHQLGIPPEVL